MSSPGTAPQPTDPPGLAQYRTLLSSGQFTQQDVEDWKSAKSLELAKGGFSRADIDAYWGDTKTAPELAAVMARNADSPHEAKNAYEELLGGWQYSVTGLLSHGKPTLAHSPKAGVLGDVAHAVGQFVGDLPASIPGGLAGTSAGAAIPVAGETGIPEVLGGGFGFNAAPQAIREAALAAYNKGHSFNWTDAWNAAVNTVKAGTVGAVTNLVGGPAAKVAAKAGLRTFGQTVTRLGAEAATATATGAALDGHVPSAQDFAAGALLVFGLHKVGGIAGRVVAGKYQPSDAESRINANLQQIYRETGVPPWEAARVAREDPVLYQELVGQDTSGNPSTVKFKSKAGVEPAPFPKAPKPGEGSEGAKVSTVDDLLPLIRGVEEHTANVGEELVRYDAAEFSAQEAATKPHGLYASSLAPGTESPHQDLGQKHTFRVKPSSPLDVPETKVTHARFAEFNPGTASAGVSALKHLLGDDEFARLAKMDKKSLVKELEEKFPGPDYSKYHDSYELLEAYGAQEARVRGHDIIRQQSVPIGDTDFSESVVLNPRIILPLVRTLEGSGDSAISKAGAIGRYQIMPGTARQYGFDPAHLMDPHYNETVARSVLSDLVHRYNGDTAAVLVAYNAGPGRAAKFLAAGRDPSVLPKETQKYLEHAEAEGVGLVGPYRPDWRKFHEQPGQVLRFQEDGSLIPDPHAVASYLQEFGRLAGFRFAVSPGETESGVGGAFVTGRAGSRIEGMRAVHMPDTPDELTRRWYGLGRYEILYHEIGHAIDKHIGAKSKIDSPELRAELTESSKQWKPVIWQLAPDHARKDNELIADGIARWLSDPTARKQMPLFTKALGEQLKPYADIAAKALPTRSGNGDWKDPPGNSFGGGWYGPSGGGKGGKPPGEPPPSASGEGEGPKKLSAPDRIALTFDTRAQRFQEDMIGEEGKTGYSLGDAVRQFVSELKPGEDIDKILREQGRLGPKDMGIADMFRQTYGSEGRALSMLRDGPIDASADPLNLAIRKAGVKPYMQILSDVQKGGGTLEGFDYWRNAQRTVQLDRRGIQGTMPIEEAKKTLKDAPEIYEQADKDLQKFQQAILEYGRDSGIFSQKQIDAMLKAGPSYVSFRRVMGDNKSYSTMRGLGRTFRVGRATFKIEGSDRQIVSPLLSDIDNVRLITKMADRNRAVRSAIGPLSKPVGGLPALVKKERIIDIAEPGSDVFKPYNLDAQAEKAFIPMTAVKAEQGDRNTFTVYEDGKPVLYRAESEPLAQLMRGADSPQEANIFDRIFTTASKLTRLGVVLSPDFPVRIGLRHEMTAFVYDPLHPPPIVNFVAGFMDAFKKGEGFKAWAANGGAGATFAEMGETTLKQDIYKLFDETGFTNKAWNVVRHPIQAGLALSEFVSTANRVGYYKRAIGMGQTPLKAATMSRTAYLDYSERGTAGFMNVWSKWTPFLRAHMLGTEMLAKAYARDPIGTVGLLALSHTVPAVLLYVLNYFQDKSGQIPADQQYKNIPRWEKDTYYILPQVGGVRLRIPYGFQSGALGGGLIQRFLDSELQKDPHAFDDWAHSMANEFIPPLIPGLARPIQDIATNKNWFSGKPLIPDSLKDASGPYQFTDMTSEPAKALSKLLPSSIAISPIYIDEMVRGWAGSLGQLALKAADTTMGHPGMPWEVADIPFVQSFVVRNRGATPQVIEDFYSDLDKVREKNANFSAASHRGDYASMLKMADGPAFYSLDNIAKAISVQHNLIRGIDENAAMTTDEKREKIDHYYALMIAEAKSGSAKMRKLGLLQ